MPRRARVPDCTHGVLDRVYDPDQTCFVCGRPPALGFLYQCIQDHDPETLHDCILLADPDHIEPVKSNVRLRLERFEMSESVILAAELGHYTDAHLDRLIDLKQELRQTILDKLQGGKSNNAMSKWTSIVGSVSSRFPSNNDGTSTSMPAKDASQIPRGCLFRACHACRPYYRERVFISFQAVHAGDFAPMTRASSERLPTKSSGIMRTIGNTVPSLPSVMTLGTIPSTLPTSSSFPYSTEVPNSASTSCSDITFKTTQSDVDEISAQRRPRRRFYSMGRRTSGDIARDLSRLPSFFSSEGLKTAVQSIFRPSRDSSSSGSNVTLPLPRTGTARDLNELETVGEFDIGVLRRVRRQKERNQLKNGTYTGGFEDVDENIGAHSYYPKGEHDGSSENYSVYSCVEEGSEVEVEGGLALREETVVMHTPDLHAVDMDQMKAGSASCAEEVEDECGDIGMQSIIAHQM
ncbi:hypothetical protein T440DRAFT_528740 [Plenodomus tracheiphilus IPT5]|uniref:Uncharacterized protein n=1 Tax=Plenodomus tracheiphilus IPT5 TaxID=1408161 RepID=A0A6A7B812_9PLEO|nr:hypothetical protein T440DRAFT_528740 [Plenodomus tracheiphilus IPT5]